MNRLLNYKAKYTINLDIPSNSAPDEYYIESKKATPDNNFIISKDKAGTTLSIYCDDVWDLTPYRTTNNVSKLYFSFIDEEQREDSKWIIFMMVYLSNHNNYSRLSVSTIHTYLKTVRTISKYSISNSISISTTIESEQHLAKLVSQCKSKYSLSALPSILNNILYLGSDISGFTPIEHTFILKIKSQLSLISKDKQFPVIPPRILSNYISFLQDHITLIQKYKNEIETLIERRYNYPVGNFFKRLKYHDKNNEYPSYIGLSKIYNLDTLSSKYNLHSISSLSNYLARTQDCCKTLIHIYSGMRKSEAFSLKIDCLQYEKSDIGKTYRLLGQTSKLIGQIKNETWITSDEIDGAISVAQWIARMISRLNEFDFDESPLFISTAYLRPSYIRNTLYPPKVNSLTNKTQHISNYIDKSLITIDSNDFDFLEKIDPYRMWQDENDFKIGATWNFTSHQFRRSLAFYASQSATVSLPSLKRQLKHVTNEMTIYYSKGSGLSKNSNGKETFFNHLHKTKPEADTYAYYYDVILSDESLFGAHGTYIERSSSSNNSDVRILDDRKKLLTLFKNGEIAYTSTPLGGCTTINPCDKKAMREISACMSCRRSVIKISKLKKVIKEQRALVKELENLNSTSMEYKMESSELNLLLTFLKKISKNQGDYE